jgi:hypothetical protein
MISKKIALFAIGSMFAAGATLASNVTFGQKAARWVAENFDFVGPMGNALSAVVRNPEYDRRAPVMGFQVGAAASSPLVVTAGQPFEFSVFDSKTGLTRQSLVSPASSARQNGDAFAATTPTRLAEKIKFNNLVGDNNSNINNLAKSFLRNGSLLEEKDLASSLLNPRDSLKGGFTGGILASSVPAAGNEIAQILNAATNGNPLVATSVIGTSATGQATPTATTVPATATPLSPAGGSVPVPGVLGLLAIGLAAYASARRK